MALQPNQEDLRKVHNEVNQIMHQRFLVTTAAITVFGIMIAWSFPRTAEAVDEQRILSTCAVSVSLNLVLAALSWLNISLRRYSRVLTTYLVVANMSGWEADWEKHRRFLKFRHTDYNKPQSLVFLLLGVLATLYPFFVTGVSGLEYPSRLAVGSVVAAGLLELILAGVSLSKRIEGESDAKDQWQAVNRLT